MTLEDVAQAKHALEAEGTYPSYAAIRRKLGYGSCWDPPEINPCPPQSHCEGGGCWRVAVLCRSTRGLESSDRVVVDATRGRVACDAETHAVVY